MVSGVSEKYEQTKEKEQQKKIRQILFNVYKKKKNCFSTFPYLIFKLVYF